MGAPKTWGKRREKEKLAALTRLDCCTSTGVHVGHNNSNDRLFDDDGFVPLEFSLYDTVGDAQIGTPMWL